MYYSHEREFCVPVVHIFTFRSNFHFQFSFGTRTAHQENMSNLSDLMYALIIKHCLVYFCVAVSRVLRIMTQNESCYIRQLCVVELAVGSEQKL